MYTRPQVPKTPSGLPYYGNMEIEITVNDPKA